MTFPQPAWLRALERRANAVFANSWDDLDDLTKEELHEILVRGLDQPGAARAQIEAFRETFGPEIADIMENDLFGDPRVADYASLPKRDASMAGSMNACQP